MFFFTLVDLLLLIKQHIADWTWFLLCYIIYIHCQDFIAFISSALTIHSIIVDAVRNCIFVD